MHFSFINREEKKIHKKSDFYNSSSARLTQNLNSLNCFKMGLNNKKSQFQFYIKFITILLYIVDIARWIFVMILLISLEVFSFLRIHPFLYLLLCIFLHEILILEPIVIYQNTTNH